jgi:2-(1,2-epoxy-1,2-dihydrophenyl)acetyl-CoA isomerase
MNKYETVIYEKEDSGIATLTFNRPQVLNAQNRQMLTEMRAAIDDARGDDNVRVLILTGTGRGFHAGDDVKQIFLAPDWESRHTDRSIQELKGIGLRRKPMYLQEFFKPVIAAVNGPAVGAGLEIALECDIRIASPEAKFGWFFVRRGLPSTGTPDGAMMLAHIIGLSRALEMMMSGELMEAAEAERVGLVSQIVPQEKLMQEARELADKFLHVAPLAQQAIKRIVRTSLFDPTTVPELIIKLRSTLDFTEDFKEGTRSFAEKRPPVYKGR